MSMKAEMEMAMKLLEKDVHDKQDTIMGLRQQMEDVKRVNLEMYTKLQVKSNKRSERILVCCLLSYKLILQDADWYQCFFVCQQI